MVGKKTKLEREYLEVHPSNERLKKILNDSISKGNYKISLDSLYEEYKPRFFNFFEAKFEHERKEMSEKTQINFKDGVLYDVYIKNHEEATFHERIFKGLEHYLIEENNVNLKRKIKFRSQKISPYYYESVRDSLMKYYFDRSIVMDINNLDFGDFFKELIVKHNEKFRGTHAEIKFNYEEDYDGNYDHLLYHPKRVLGGILQRSGLTSIISEDLNLKSTGLYPITPEISERLQKNGKGGDFDHEHLGLILYKFDTNSENYLESKSLLESIKENLYNSRNNNLDFDMPIMIENSGIEVDLNMPHGVKFVYIPGITTAYNHESLTAIYNENKENKIFYGAFFTLSKSRHNENFPYTTRTFNGYDTNRGLPLISQFIPQDSKIIDRLLIESKRKMISSYNGLFIYQKGIYGDSIDISCPYFRTSGGGIRFSYQEK